MHLNLYISSCRDFSLLLSEKKKQLQPGHSIPAMENFEPIKTYTLDWKLKIPIKIRFFLWLISKKLIRTMDNLLKRGCQGTNRCYTCGKTEIIDHLFFQCSVASCIWSVIGSCFGITTKPRSTAEFYGWSGQKLPGNEFLHLIGFAAVSWAIWSFGLLEMIFVLNTNFYLNLQLYFIKHVLFSLVRHDRVGWMYCNIWVTEDSQFLTQIRK